MFEDVPLFQRFPLIFLLLVAFLLGGVSLSPTQLMGQDPIFTQYFFNKLYLNPAYAGYEGGLIVNSSLRQQWNHIDGEGGTGYRTQMIGASLAVPNLFAGIGMSGFGLQYVRQVEGPGNLVWHRAGLAYAFRTRDCNARWARPEFNLGFRLSANWTGLNQQDAFTYGDQYHPVEGLVYSTNAPDNLTFFPSQTFMDLDIGAVYLQPLQRRSRKADADYVRIGLVANHLPGRDSEVAGFFNGLPMRYTFHNEWIFRYGNNQFVPMLKVEAQPAGTLFLPNLDDRYWAWHQQIGAVGTIYDEIDRGIWFGAWYHGRVLPQNDPQPSQAGIEYSFQRNIHSLSIAAGAELPLHETQTQTARQHLRLGISYDFLFSGIPNDATGIFEVSLILSINDFGRGSVIGCRPVCAQF